MKGKARLIFLTLIALLAIVLLVIFPHRHSEQLLFGGTVEATLLHLGSRVGGRVEKVYVEEGDKVIAGTRLVSLEKEEWEAKRENAAAAVQAAEADLRYLLKGFRPEEIQRLQAKLEQAQANAALIRKTPRKEEVQQARLQYESAETLYNQAVADVQRIQSLYEKELATKDALEKAQTEMLTREKAKQTAFQELKLLLRSPTQEKITLADQKVKEAKAALLLAKRGYTQAEIDRARALLKQAKARLREVEADLKELNIKAPAAGIIDSIDIEQGDLVLPNAPILTLLLPKKLTVTAYVPETKLSQVAIGKQCQILIDDPHSLPIRGKVISIAQEAEFTPRNIQTKEERAHQYFAVKIKILKGRDQLRSGMAVQVLFPTP